MKEILNQEGKPLQGERGGGILWSKNDVFAQVMGLEHCGCVCGVGFGSTPLGRNGLNLSQYTLTPPLSSETTWRITKLETSLASVKEQLAQSEARHEEQVREIMLQMREMFAQFIPHMCSSQLSQVPKKFNLTKLNLLQCIVM